MEKAIEIKRRAQRCVQNGDLDGALREYEKLVETPESDPYNFVLLADLLYKKGDQPHAAERYLNAVMAYEKAGLYKNAIAVCKKMMRLTLSQTQVLRHLAELHALDGLSSEASIYFSQYAEHMVRANNSTEAAAALRKAFDNGQENVKLLEQMAEVLLLDGQAAKAAVTMREAAGHWHTRGQQSDARRCVERANRMDPATSTPVSAPGNDPAEAMPQLVLPGTPTAPTTPAIPPAAPPAAPVANAPIAAPPAQTQPQLAPALPLELRSAALEPARPVLRTPGQQPPSAVPPPAPTPSGQFEHSPTFVAPSLPAADSSVTPPVPDAAEAEETTPEAGVYEIAAEEDTNYATALSAVAAADTAPPASVFPPVPGGPPPAVTPRQGVMLDGVTLVEHLLQRAQDEFRAGDRDKASAALVEAAVTYESLGRLDSAATIFRSLGRGAHSPLEVMTLWLANCEKRNDRTEGSQVACELGDRALNDGQEAQARTWFEHAAAIDPTNETARRRIQRMSGAPGKAMPAPMPAPGTAPPPEAGRVEVALGRGQAMTFDLGSLLEEFQRGVESQLDGDTQGHYDLGMAYREMGLQDQAVEAFRIAVRDPRLAGRAHEMIGRCHADTGAHDAAVEEFTEALGLGSLDGAGEAELRLQLGISLAALGDYPNAVQQLEIADSRYPGRGDVAERLAEWRRTFGKAA